MTPTCELSIIVPAYQAEKHLARCLSSFLGGLSCTSEVIVVNDASCDATQKIADSFAQNHPGMLKVITHSHNQGVSASRNTGLAAATGSLVMFVDADDWIDRQEFVQLLKLQHQTGADLTCGNACVTSASQKESPRFPQRYGIFSLKPQIDSASLLSHLPLLDTCWGKIFNNQFLQEREIKFYTTLKYGEDTLFSNSFALVAETVAINYDCRFYRYFQSETSCMRTTDAHTRLQQLDILVCALAELSAGSALADHIVLRKACEAIWSIHKFTRNTAERKDLLTKFWTSAAYQRGLYECIAKNGKKKHRLLWKLLQASQNGWDAFWLRCW